MQSYLLVIEFFGILWQINLVELVFWINFAQMKVQRHDIFQK